MAASAQGGHSRGVQRIGDGLQRHPPFAHGDHASAELRDVGELRCEPVRSAGVDASAAPLAELHERAGAEPARREVRVQPLVDGHHEGVGLVDPLQHLGEVGRRVGEVADVPDHDPARGARVDPVHHVREPGPVVRVAVRVVDHALQVPVASVAPRGDRGRGDGDPLVARRRCPGRRRCSRARCGRSPRRAWRVGGERLRAPAPVERDQRERRGEREQQQDGADHVGRGTLGNRGEGRRRCRRRRGFGGARERDARVAAGVELGERGRVDAARALEPVLDLKPADGAAGTRTERPVDAADAIPAGVQLALHGTDAAGRPDRARAGGDRAGGPAARPPGLRHRARGLRPLDRAAVPARGRVRGGCRRRRGDHRGGQRYASEPSPRARRGGAIEHFIS